MCEREREREREYIHTLTHKHTQTHTANTLFYTHQPVNGNTHTHYTGTHTHTTLIPAPLLSYTHTSQSTATHTHSDITAHALPEGWRECKDPQTGRIFFQNDLTYETNWTRPKHVLFVSHAHSKLTNAAQTTVRATLMSLTNAHIGPDQSTCFVCHVHTTDKVCILLLLQCWHVSSSVQSTCFLCHVHTHRATTGRRSPRY